MGGFGREVEEDGVHTLHHERIQVGGLRGGIVPGTLLQRDVAGIGDREPRGEGRTRFAPHADALPPHVRVGRIGIVHDARAQRVGREGLLDVEVHVAIVAGGVGEGDALERHLIDRLADERVAVERTHVVQSPAHVHHQSLSIGVSHALHPGERIKHGRGIHEEGAEDELCIEGDPAVLGSRSTTTADAGHV